METYATRYPFVGATCKMQVSAPTFLALTRMQKDGDGKNGPHEHCPDFDERFTLVDGRTRAIPCPQTKCNCVKEFLS